MHYERYEFTDVSGDGKEYYFTSSGPNGDIKLTVQFTETCHLNIYNLSFGNLIANGDVDDMVKNRNQDRNKVLATVAVAAMDFLSKKPKAQLVFKGSNEARTRLYRMAISANLTLLQKSFELRGLTSFGDYSFVKTFRSGENYSGFLVKKKTYI
ncbi:hypothetical protein HHL16_08905 [Pseudoflavitalea sp. G-6-1-2]|uniref:DUF6934 family protein n=1 Tax=Pseudoflavitalea sp. G-6-1-2 TaxID=2728841 RepID=UPI00146C40CA|nr:hypothetical protein [Pseudoflavitalea sp. G-6-1-2]NML20991.1 hypothetical protein [Pseudoflavitalea sp. G-6-1-2]